MAHAIQGAGKSQEADAPQSAGEKHGTKIQAPNQSPQDSVKISPTGQAAAAKNQTSDKPPTKGQR
jgi:hypothetical protein